MQYRQLGKTGIDISAITYGGIVSMDAVQEDSDRYVEWALEQGINYFDVAPTYGDAQLKLGQSLIPYRDKIKLACKTKARTAKEAMALFEESRRLLHTDYFDVYQLHEVTTPEDVYMFRALIQYKENEQAFGFGLTDRLGAKLNRYRRKKKENV